MCVLLGLDAAFLQLIGKKATGSSEPAVCDKHSDEDRGDGYEVDDEVTDHGVVPYVKVVTAYAATFAFISAMRLAASLVMTGRFFCSGYHSSPSQISS